MAISKVLGLPAIEWPYRLATRREVNIWLDKLSHARFVRSADREFGRLIRRLENDERNVGNDPNRYYDCDIWTAIWRFENGLGTICWTDTDPSGAVILYGQHEESERGEAVPHYTTKIEDALTLWPFDAPADWAGTALECAIEGLRLRKAWNFVTLNEAEDNE